MHQQEGFAQEGKDKQTLATVEHQQFRNLSWQNRYSDEEQNEDCDTDQLIDHHESLEETSQMYDAEYQPQSEIIPSDEEYGVESQELQPPQQQTIQHDLSNAQNNVNSLFKRLQNKFSTV